MQPGKRPCELVLGVDPDASESLQTFADSLARHEALLESPLARSNIRWLKPNLAFFLQHGSGGIALLEGFARRQKPHYALLLDAKFSEIENSLRGSLAFAFETLGVQGVTLNPFLGERSVRLALDVCAKTAGAQGRVYVLCRTSEASEGPLAALQADWKGIVSCVALETARLAQQDPALASVGGVVIGAGREDVLLSEHLVSSGLSVLAPGLGAQGASSRIIDACARVGLREVLFPMSRGIFAGGVNDPSVSLARLNTALSSFSVRGPS